MFIIIFTIITIIHIYIYTYVYIINLVAIEPLEAGGELGLQEGYTIILNISIIHNNVDNTNHIIIIIIMIITIIIVNSAFRREKAWPRWRRLTHCSNDTNIIHDNMINIITNNNIDNNSQNKDLSQVGTDLSDTGSVSAGVPFSHGGRPFMYGKGKVTKNFPLVPSGPSSGAST